MKHDWHPSSLRSSIGVTHITSVLGAHLFQLESWFLTTGIPQAPKKRRNCLERFSSEKGHDLDPRSHNIDILPLYSPFWVLDNQLSSEPHFLLVTGRFCVLHLALR